MTDQPTPALPDPDAAPLVDIDGLSKRYGSFRAVDDVSMQVRPGEIVALLGPNGAGKTTTIRMLIGILQPTRGAARIGGLDCFAQRERVMAMTGYLPDEPVFYDYLRGSEILRFVGSMHDLDPALAAARIGELVERLGLDDALEEFAVNYSKGMKKKLALACALLHEPAVLILDEPTNGLDPFATRTLHAMVRAAADRGAAVLYSTHLLAQAEQLCDRVGILHRARLARFGPLGELRDTLAPGGSLEDVFFEVARDDAGDHGGGHDPDAAR